MKIKSYSEERIEIENKDETFVFLNLAYYQGYYKTNNQNYHWKLVEYRKKVNKNLEHTLTIHGAINPDTTYSSIIFNYDINGFNRRIIDLNNSENVTRDFIYIYNPLTSDTKEYNLNITHNLSIYNYLKEKNRLYKNQKDTIINTKFPDCMIRKFLKTNEVIGEYLNSYYNDYSKVQNMIRKRFRSQNKNLSK